MSHAAKRAISDINNHMARHALLCVLVLSMSQCAEATNTGGKEKKTQVGKKKNTGGKEKNTGGKEKTTWHIGPPCSPHVTLVRKCSVGVTRCVLCAPFSPRATD